MNTASLRVLELWETLRNLRKLFLYRVLRHSKCLAQEIEIVYSKRVNSIISRRIQRAGRIPIWLISF